MDCLNAPIDIGEEISSLTRLKSQKAIGIDGFASEFNEYSDGHLIEPNTVLFNFVFDSGNYPEAWSTGIINPLHKKNSKLLPDNYRKITIQPALGKLFDTVLNTRLAYIKSVLRMNDPLMMNDPVLNQIPVQLIVHSFLTI